jgi:putative transposase
VILETGHIHNIYNVYSLYSYFLCLSLRKVSERLHLSLSKETVFLFGTGYKSEIRKIFSKNKKITEYVIDETVIKVETDYIWI